MRTNRAASKHKLFLALQAVLTFLATFFVIARFIAKRMTFRKWTWDDTFLATALVFLYVAVPGAMSACALGYVWDRDPSATPEELMPTLILLWALQFPHAICLMFVRLSISILFIRIFYTQLYPRLRYTAYLCIVCTLALALVVILVNMTRCRPLKYNWSLPLENPRYCYSAKPYILVARASGMVVDGVTWSLPHFVVWRLRLPLVHKMAITTIFFLGLLNIIMEIFRIKSLLRDKFIENITYDAANTLLWAVARLSTAIIVACCPLLRPLFEKLVPKRLTRIASHAIPQKKHPGIRVTTRIEVHNGAPRIQTYSHQHLQETDRPTFDVESHNSSAST